MRRLVTGMRNNQGFTLIEIMIVLVIVGITFGFALIAFGDFGEGRRIQFAAEQLVNNLKLAQQQAILENSTLGLHIDNVSYQLLQLKPPSVWQPLSSKGVSKVNFFPKNTIISLKTESHSLAKAPEIIINSSGDMTPFVLTFGTRKESKITVLNGYRNGNLQFSVTNSK